LRRTRRIKNADALRVVPTDIAQFLGQFLESAVTRLKFEAVLVGNMNRLLICSSPRKSVVVKSPRRRVDLGIDDITAPIERVDLEVFALRHFSVLNPGAVPEVLFQSIEYPCFVMEYIAEDVRWLNLDAPAQLYLTRECIKPFISSAKSEALSGSPLTKLPERVRRASVQMQEVIERVTFDLPFGRRPTPYSDILGTDGARDLSEFIHAIQNNQNWKEMCATLLSHYRTVHPRLIHGDLHIGSIICRNGRLVIIDPEFACQSVPEFDAGVFVAHAIMAAVSSEQSGRCSAKYIQYIADSFITACWSEITQNTRSSEKFQASNSGLDRSLAKGFMLVELFAKLAGPVASPFLISLANNRRASALLDLACYVKDSIEQITGSKK